MLTNSVEQEKERIIRSAVGVFETVLRERVSKLALTLANYYSLQMQGSEVVIRVRIDDLRHAALQPAAAPPPAE